jgi:pantoate--beta-alanine ligase
MKLCTTIPGIREARAEIHSPLALVPTMGALHSGHISLVRAAKARSKSVAVSIFVNPTQFGPTEDLSKYPRPFERDRALLEAEGIDILFAPSPDEIYPHDAVTWVTVEGLSDKLDGRSRPGHFRGVTTIVAKLFNLIQPQVAFFGQKDAAQLAILRRMSRDLNFPVEIVGCPIVREPDGLALSSRNAYLNPAERRQALVLHRALLEVEKQFASGERSASNLIAIAKKVFASEKDLGINDLKRTLNEPVSVSNPKAVLNENVRIDYIEIVDPDSLDPVDEITRKSLVALAAYVGSTRLIDNTLLGD